MAYDEHARKVRLSLRQADILAALASDEKLATQGDGAPDVEARNVK